MWVLLVSMSIQNCSERNCWRRSQRRRRNDLQSPTGEARKMRRNVLPSACPLIVSQIWRDQWESDFGRSKVYADAGHDSCHRFKSDLVPGKGRRNKRADGSALISWRVWGGQTLLSFCQSRRTIEEGWSNKWKTTPALVASAPGSLPNPWVTPLAASSLRRKARQRRWRAVKSRSRRKCKIWRYNWRRFTWGNCRKRWHWKPPIKQENSHAIIDEGRVFDTFQQTKRWGCSTKIRGSRQWTWVLQEKGRSTPLGALACRSRKEAMVLWRACRFNCTGLSVGEWKTDFSYTITTSLLHVRRRIKYVAYPKENEKHKLGSSSKFKKLEGSFLALLSLRFMVCCYVYLLCSSRENRVGENRLGHELFIEAFL